MIFSPFILKLLQDKCGSEIHLSRDCELLALDIESVTGEHIGVNTIKRLLGYIADERAPRTSTLDIIARYLGFADWEALRLLDAESSNSAFDERSECMACHLRIGQKIVVRYAPYREIAMKYLGEDHFEVIESKNSKLQEGDLLTLTHIVRGYPLLVSEVVRGGNNLGRFVAGKEQGIDFSLL